MTSRSPARAGEAARVRASVHRLSSVLALASRLYLHADRDRIALSQRGRGPRRNHQFAGVAPEAATGRAAPAPAAAAKPIPALRVGSFKVTQGSVSYQDEAGPRSSRRDSRRSTSSSRISSPGSREDCSPSRESSKLGERVEWHGHMSIQPVESDGELRIQGLRARTLWEYLAGSPQFRDRFGDHRCAHRRTSSR